MSALNPGNVLQRETLVAMLRAALLSGDLRFARQAALAWLAAFPGDLEVTLLQAQVLLQEGRAAQALSALEMVCGRDPFSAQAYKMLAQACQADRPSRSSDALTCLFVLNGQVPAQARLEPWGMGLRKVYLAIEARQFGEADILVHDVLLNFPDLLLAVALHLLVVRAIRDALSTQRMAEYYYTRWPECLPIGLILAEANLKLGNEMEAVRLLHLCVAGDSTGQTAARLWGPSHPYRALWPEDPVILFDLPVPAGVAGRLGWNHLPQGEVIRLEPPGEPVVEASAAEAAAAETAAPEAVELEEAPAVEMEPAEGTSTEVPSGQTDLLVDEKPADTPQEAEGEGETEEESDSSPAAAEEPAAHSAAVQPAPGAPQADSALRERVRRRKTARKEGAGETIQAVTFEFERLAKKLKQPDLARADGRSPVYVIFTSREGIVGQYGPQTAAILNSEMGKLASLIRQRPGWNAVVYYADDAICTAGYELTPVNPRDPWKLKNALADLDGALAKRGEMIGALLIVGGDQIVPFHRLPNPTEDADGEVISDCPYSMLGANYFVPDWPVGRAPGESGPDAGLLLEQLRQIQRYHARRKSARAMLGLDWSVLLRSLFEWVLPAPKAPSFGYTAAVWRRSALAVFRPIGDPHAVKASPPEDSSSINRERLAASRLGYYNLHGLEDSPAWYGQRDPAERVDAPDYPVALSPVDLHRNGRAPQVIFSEACYGGHIFGKGENESLALKFLSMGTLAVVGSTCISYGSINTPLIAADLLSNLFWQNLKAGMTAGESLLKAKVELVREMNRRQGFLDGEDQKTLISFVLYGDPLAACEGFRARGKAVYRFKDHPLVKTVSDHADGDSAPLALSDEALRQVKQIVAEYLPGADLNHLHLTRQSAPENGEPAVRQKNQPGNEPPARPPAAGKSNGRLVVTVSKQVKVADIVHRHYMRVTLDEGGKPVKLSASR